MTDRPDLDTYYLKMAYVVALRGTCARRQVGCVLVDERGHVLSTGYNGRPRGWAHCRSSDGIFAMPCAGADAPSGEQLDSCEAIHAEQNALLQCPDVDRVHTCYTTTSPCVTCAKLLLNTGCRRIVFAERYAQDAMAMNLLAGGRVDVKHLPMIDTRSLSDT